MLGWVTVSFQSGDGVQKAVLNLKVPDWVEATLKNWLNTHYDEQPFTGRAVAEYMGKQGAMILALAHILETLIPTDEGF